MLHNWSLAPYIAQIYFVLCNSVLANVNIHLYIFEECRSHFLEHLYNYWPPSVYTPRKFLPRVLPFSEIFFNKYKLAEIFLFSLSLYWFLKKAVDETIFEDGPVNIISQCFLTHFHSLLLETWWCIVKFWFYLHEFWCIDGALLFNLYWNALFGFVWCVQCSACWSDWAQILLWR